MKKRTLHEYDWRGAVAGADAAAFDYKQDDRWGLERQSCMLDAVHADMSWFDELLVSDIEHACSVACAAYVPRCVACCFLYWKNCNNTDRNDDTPTLLSPS